MTTNKAKIEKKLNELGLNIGGWDSKIEELNPANLKKVIDNLEFESDTDVSIKRKKHVVELDIMDNEIDFSVLTKDEYISRYGDERWDNL